MSFLFDRILLFLSLLLPIQSWILPWSTEPHHVAFWKPRLQSFGLILHAPLLNGALAEQGESSSSREEDVLQADKEEAQQPEKKQQLWLDLRGTAIRPLEALTFLQEFVFDDKKDADDDKDEGEQCTNEDMPRPPAQSIPILDLVDRIVVGEESFADIVRTSRNATNNLFYVTSKGDLVENWEETQQSFVRGKVLSPDRNGIFDPMEAFGIPNDPQRQRRGGTIILIDSMSAGGGSDDNAQQPFIDQVESLLQLVNAASSGVGTSLLGDSDEATLFVPPSCVAVACPTRSVLISIDRSVVTSQALGAGFCQTDSGILVPTTSSKGDKGGEVPTTALLLPFDLRLWRTACELRQPNQE